MSKDEKSETADGLTPERVRQAITYLITSDKTEGKLADIPMLLKLAAQLENEQAEAQAVEQARQKQLALWGDDREVEAGGGVPGQAESKRGKVFFFKYLAAQFPNIDDVYHLMAEGWDWRKAVYIVWLATPRGRRRPLTAENLATKVLALAGPRVFSNWRSDKSWPIEERAAQLAMSRAKTPGPDRLAAVVEAAYESAGLPGREGYPDRKMIFEMLGLVQPGGINVTAQAGAVANVPLLPEDIPDDELNLIADNLVIAAASQALAGQQIRPEEPAAKPERS